MTPGSTSPRAILPPSRVRPTCAKQTLYQIVCTYLLKGLADEPVYQFLDKKQPHFVYMTAAQNKFLRIYYACVKECLLAAGAQEFSES